MGIPQPVAIGAVLRRPGARHRRHFGVELLKAFIDVGSTPWQELAWRVGIHLTFVVSGALFAVTDWITERKGGH